MRLTNEEMRRNFEYKLQKTLLKITNAYSNENNDEQTYNLLSRINFKKISTRTKRKKFQ